VPGAFEIAGKSFDNDTLIGIAVRKGDTAMKSAVETALKASVADGTYAALLKKYNLPAGGSIF
jgi:polar amino acid transport system substrate-binding protein